MILKQWRQILRKKDKEEFAIIFRSSSANIAYEGGNGRDDNDQGVNSSH